ncbi:uncharacterized protein LOC119085483 [Bradysia coprophila]|uniref:uncharacterized protein LOC119085483 n=1 Tax=Bradysia coprophila TaxID=38358 RepID=UPI00187D86EA|nr:uncharacterized protein LOC119085483 [Bradysia coprophila]
MSVGGGRRGSTQKKKSFEVLSERQKSRRAEELSLKILGIRVDFPSARGAGNSNNGNLCRVAFSKPLELSKILGVSKKLINNIRVILIALSCQLPLNIERFHNFCKETARRYIKKYYWFPLPQSIHKVLIHSRDIMLANDLTVGVLAEDASESCNKLYRHNRLFHARKNSRKNNLEDVFNRALDSSDPIVASFGLQNRQKSRFRKNIPHDVLSLLQAPDEPASRCYEEGDTEDLDATEMDINEDGLTEDFTETLDRLHLEEDHHYEECDDDDDVEEADDRESDDTDFDDTDSDDSYSDDDESEVVMDN